MMHRTSCRACKQMSIYWGSWSFCRTDEPRTYNYLWHHSLWWPYRSWTSDQIGPKCMRTPWLDPTEISSTNTGNGWKYRKTAVWDRQSLRQPTEFILRIALRSWCWWVCLWYLFPIYLWCVWFWISYRPHWFSWQFWRCGWFRPPWTWSCTWTNLQSWR